MDITKRMDNSKPYSTSEKPLERKNITDDTEEGREERKRLFNEYSKLY